MALLGRKTYKNGPSSGNDFDRIKEPIFGSGRGKINRRKELFGSDYIYLYREVDDDDLAHDGEIGINKNYHRIHDMDWCNGEKNEHHAINRFFDKMEDIVDGEMDLTDIEEFLFGDDEGDTDE